MPSTTPRLLLNVDDNEVGRYSKTRILRHAGFDVIEAETGQKAIDLVHERHPDLVLLDVKLPDISGLEVCRILKRDYPKLFVLQISASRVTEGDRVRGLDGGADSYLTQPIAPTELVASVRAMLRIRSAEDALRASEAHLQGVLASAVDYAIIRVDEQGNISGWNEGATSIFGWTEAEALGRDISFIFTTEDQEAQAPRLEQERARSTGRSDDKRWHIKKDGSLFYANGVMTRLSPPATPGFVKILRDQTTQFETERALHELATSLEMRVVERTQELQAANDRLKTEMEDRVRAEELLHQRDKMDALGQLTGGIAHDFNNMLAVVMAGLGLIERQVSRGETDIGKYIQGVMESAKRAADLTQGLLAFARQQPLAPEPTDTNQLITRLAELLGRTLGENIKIRTALEDSLWKTRIDPTQLESALLNLAVNARDAMEDGGTLTIKSENALIDSADSHNHEISVGEYVKLSVCDTGSGMAPDVIAKAFDPFFTTKGIGKGTGLGLSQVFGFVRQSGGHVRIQSEVNVGTSVKIYLPRHIGDEEVAARGPRKQTAVGRASEIVLVVEDEERVRLMAVDALSDLGYTVLQASNGIEALRVIGEGQKPNLLFTDLVMPEMSGRELASRVSALFPDIKILFTSGYARDALLLSSSQISASHFLKKPFALDQLAAKVRSVLDHA
jgi:PAS domain S-box-containing protein